MKENEAVNVLRRKVHSYNWRAQVSQPREIELNEF